MALGVILSGSGQGTEAPCGGSVGDSAAERLRSSRRQAREAAGIASVLARQRVGVRAGAEKRPPVASLPPQSLGRNAGTPGVWEHTCPSPSVFPLSGNYLLKNGTSDVLLCGNSSDAGYVAHPPPRATSPSRGEVKQGRQGRGHPSVLSQLTMLSAYALDPRLSPTSLPCQAPGILSTPPPPQGRQF